MAATVLVSGPALRSFLQLVDQADGAAGERLEAHGNHGEIAQTRCWSCDSFEDQLLQSVWFSTPLYFCFNYK